MENTDAARSVKVATPDEFSVAKEILYQHYSLDEVKAKFLTSSLQNPKEDKRVVKEAYLLGEYYLNVTQRAEILLSTCFPGVTFPRNEVIESAARVNAGHASLEKIGSSYVLGIAELPEEKEELIKTLDSSNPYPFMLEVTYGEGTKVLREVEDVVAVCHEKIHELFCELIAKNNPDYPIQTGQMLMYLLYEGFSVNGELRVLDLMTTQASGPTIETSIETRKQIRLSRLEKSYQALASVKDDNLSASGITYESLYAVGVKLVDRMVKELGVNGFIDFLTRIDAWKAFSIRYPSQNYEELSSLSVTEIVQKLTRKTIKPPGN